MSTPPLTAGLEARILVWIRSGAFPHAAAAAEGVAPAVFERWLALGTRTAPRPVRRYREFAGNVLRAAGLARVRAEIKLLEKDAKVWLLSGPGRDRAGYPGWSSAVKAVPPPDDRTGSLLADPVLAGQVEKLLLALTPFPEARKAAAAALQDSL
jgi:hypothetical protein